MFKRIFEVFGVSALGQLINLVMRLVSMPVFLHFWGKDLYGEWLVLLAIPTYLAISGTGLSVVAANEMSLKTSKGLQNDALGIFQSVWLFISLLTLLFLLVSILIAMTFPVEKWLNITHISPSQTCASLVLLAVYMVFFLQGEILLGVYRAGEIFAKGLLVNNLTILAENTALLFTVMVTVNVLTVVAVYLAIRAIGLLTMVFVLKRHVAWFKPGIKEASFKTVKSNLIPTLSYIGINISNAFTVQGIVTIIGIRLGPAAVVSFALVRTLVNLVKQANAMVYYSIWPEFSAALAIDNRALARKLHRHACQFTFWLTAFNIALLLLFGMSILRVWTNGKVEVDYLFLTLMLFAMLPNTFYVTSSYVQISINKLEKVAVISLLGSVAFLGVTYAALPAFGILSAPVVQLLIDSALLFIIVRDSLLLVQDKSTDFFQSMFAFGHIKRKIWQTVSGYLQRRIFRKFMAGRSNF